MFHPSFKVYILNCSVYRILLSLTFLFIIIEHTDIHVKFCVEVSFFTPQPLRAVRVLFHPWCPDGRGAFVLAGGGKSLSGLYL